MALRSITQRTFSRLSIAAALALLGTTVESRGTVIVKRSFDQLCTAADLVFCGTAIKIEVRRDGTDGAIHTYTTFGHLKWIQGRQTNTTCTIRTLGGDADGESLVVQGMPRFTTGDRYVLFVRDHMGSTSPLCPIVGWRQGCFRSIRSAPGEPYRVFTYNGQPVVSASDGEPVTLRKNTQQAENATVMTIEQFGVAIRTARARLNQTPQADPTP